MDDIEKIAAIVTGSVKGKSRKDFFSAFDTAPEKKKEEFSKLKNAWACLSATKPMPEYQVENLYLNFKRQLAEKRKLPRMRTLSLLKYAAVFVFAVVLSAFFFYWQAGRTPTSTNKIYTTVVADNGQISKVILPDSSVVWLNSGTRITYDNGFAVDNREINLTGQAFFQVTKNKKIPLRVFSGNLEVKVLGTRFDVDAYPENKSVNVVLESGKIELLHTRDDRFRHELVAGEMAQCDMASQKVSLTKVSHKEFTSWKEGILIFRDEPMPSVIARLQRRYNITIEVRDPEVYRAVFTATIKNETLDEIFRSISYACSVRYKIIQADSLDAKIRVILNNR